MVQDTTTIEVEIPNELSDRMDECANQRGFRDRNHFVQKAIRDAVNAESGFTEKDKDREDFFDRLDEGEDFFDRLDEGDGISIDEAWEKLDIDPNE